MPTTASLAIPAFEPVTLPIAGSELRFPVGRVFCIGRNYPWQAGEPRPVDPPSWFLKPSTSVVEARGTLPFPPQTDEFCHEIECVVAIGAEGRDLSPEQAEALVWGYGVGLDMTRRDLQQQAKRVGGPWAPAKAFDHAAPCTALCPVSDVGHPRRAAIHLAVNGVERQRADLADLLWPIPALLSMLSHSLSLRPGDLVFTGTPSGVASLQPGDVVSGGVAGLGDFVMTVGERPTTSS